jgi:hypothetical protein
VGWLNGSAHCCSSSLDARCLSLVQDAHSTAGWRTSAVCWCWAVPALVPLQTAASGAANGHVGWGRPVVSQLISAYDHGAALRRARQAGDPYRVSARHQPLPNLSAWRCAAAGTPGRRPVARVGAPPAAAEPMCMAFHCGGYARQATRSARRRIPERRTAPIRMASHCGGHARRTTRSARRRTTPRPGIFTWRCAERVRRAANRLRVGAPKHGSERVQDAWAFHGFPPNTPCSRPRWRGRQPGRDLRPQTAAFYCFLNARCLRPGLCAHSTTRWRTSAVCSFPLCQARVSIQTAASGAANG